MQNMIHDLIFEKMMPRQIVFRFLSILIFFTAMSVSAQDMWIQKEDIGGGVSGVNRKSAVSFSINGKIYIALGKTDGNYLQDVWEYDTIAETWQQKSDFLGVARSGAFAMVMNNKAIVGTGEISGGSRTNTVYKYVPGSDTWSLMANFTGGARSYSTAFSTGTRGFVVGGDDGVLRNDMWEYDINGNTWISRIACPGVGRMKAVAFAINGVGYYGTGEIAANTPSKDFYKYDVNTNTWTQLADFGGGDRFGAVAAATLSIGYVGFGNNTIIVMEDFYAYDVASDSWTAKASLSANGRELAVAAAAGNKVYVGTGYGGAILKDFYQWDPCAFPIIDFQPVGLDVCEGTDVSFTVTISNIGGDTYQWHKDGSPVAGATSNVLDIAAVTEADEGSYTCLISNACGSAVSDAAILAVTPIPVNPPTGLLANPDTLCPGNIYDITLTADDNGDNQDTLYWYSVACEGDFEGFGYPVNNELIVSPPDPLVTTEYYVQWKNQCGETDCDTLTVFVKEVATDPTSITRSQDTICYDYNDELFLAVEGGSGDTIAWYLGDICTNPDAPFLGYGDTLDLFALGIIPAVSSNYSVRWETYCGGDEFNSNCLTIDLIVNNQISIAQHPQNKSVCEGTDPVKFGVSVEENGSFSSINYQWFHNGLAISNATLDTLTITGGVTISDTGYYFCKVHNTCDTISSDSAYLSISIGPSILIQPVLLDTICEGDSLTLTMQAEGSPELLYQWYHNGVPSMSTDTFLTINPAVFSHSGDYFCQVTNGCGVRSTDTVSMEVDTIPFIVQQPVDTIACLNGTAHFNVEADGTLPITYQWYKIDGSGSSSAMAGETGMLLEITPVSAVDTTFDYYCIVSNECFEGPSSDTVDLAMHAQIAVMDSIVSDTNNVCYTYPNYIHLTVYGGEGDSIRWYTEACEGTEIAISTDTVLAIQVPTVTTTYYARWENPCDVSACDSITIFVAQDPIAMDSIVFEDNNICYNEYDSLLLTAYGGSGDSVYWYANFDCSGVPFAVTADTFVYVHNLPINDAPYTAHFGNACGESDCVMEALYIIDFTVITNQSDDIEVCENSDAMMFVEALGEPPLDYQWFFNGNELAGEINDTLYRIPVTFADTGQYYCQVVGECDSVVSDSIHLAMYELPYFTMQPSDTAVCEGTRDTIQIKIAGSDPIMVQWFENGVEIGGQALYDTLLIIDPVQYTADYYARISNACGTQNSDTVTLRAFDTLLITKQPEPKNLCILDTARFIIEADDTEFADYTWYMIGNPNTVGSGALFEIPNLDYTHEGLYYCIISDTCGELSTDTVLLNMNEIPKIITDPYGASVCEGYLFQFEATVTGDSIVFEWFHDDVAILDSDTNILVFDPVMRGDEGIYYLDARNNCGFDATVPVELQVTYLPNMLDSLAATPLIVCPECEFDSLMLIAYGDGGGYGEYIEWYVEEISTANIIGHGDTLMLELPTATTVYLARWVNSCSGYNGSGGGGGGGGGSPNPDPNGGALSIEVVFMNNPEAPTNIYVNINDFCEDYNDSIMLWAEGGYGSILDWYIIDNFDETYIGSGDTIVIWPPRDTTIYAAQWTNHCGKSDSTVITVNVVPLPVVEMYKGDTICAGQDYKVDSLRQMVVYYESVEWVSNSATGVFDDNTKLNPVYSDPGVNIYDTTIVYLIMNTDGILPCGDRADSIQLVYMPVPLLSISPEITAICRDSSITLTAEGGVEYIWSPVGSNLQDDDSNPITFSPDITTDYYLYGINEEKCVDSLFFTLEVFPTPLVDLGDSVFLFSCEPVQLDAGGGDGSDYYIWNNGNRDRYLTVYESGSYSVIVGNPGCAVSDTGYVSLCNGRLFMPNAFSPNDDGINEVFKPVTSDPSVEFEMMIFDRWGQMVFETRDIYNGWEGDFRGDPCPAGNYVWKIYYRGQGTEAPGRQASDIGTVMLIR